MSNPDEGLRIPPSRVRRTDACVRVGPVACDRASPPGRVRGGCVPSLVRHHPRTAPALRLPLHGGGEIAVSAQAAASVPRLLGLFHSDSSQARVASSTARRPSRYFASGDVARIQRGRRSRTDPWNRVGSPRHNRRGPCRNRLSRQASLRTRKASSFLGSRRIASSRSAIALSGSASTCQTSPRAKCASGNVGSSRIASSKSARARSRSSFSRRTMPRFSYAKASLGSSLITALKWLGSSPGNTCPIG